MIEAIIGFAKLILRLTAALVLLWLAFLLFTWMAT